MSNLIISIFIINYLWTTVVFFDFLNFKNKKTTQILELKIYNLYFFLFFSGLPTFGIFFLKNNIISKVILSCGVLQIILLTCVLLLVFYFYYKLYFKFVNNYKNNNKKISKDVESITHYLITINIVFNSFFFITLLLL